MHSVFDLWKKKKTKTKKNQIKCSGYFIFILAKGVNVQVTFCLSEGPTSGDSGQFRLYLSLDGFSNVPLSILG